MKDGDIIKIGPYDFKLSFKDNLRGSQGEDLYGHINFTNETIDVYNGSTETKQQISILHETLHGIDDAYGLDLEEKQVEVLAVSLFQVLKDNKLLNKEKWKIEKAD